jgi:diguanylate cyclase (GGDEF)-like protein
MTIALILLLFVILGCTAILVDRSRSEAARLQLLVDLSEKLQLSPTIAEATRLLPSFAARLFPRLEGAVYVSDSPSGPIALAVAWSGAREQDTLQRTECNAIMRGSTYVTNGKTDPICEHSATMPDTETICVPMVDAAEAFGMLMLRAPDSTPFPPGIERLAKSFAQQVALALSNLRLQETLREAAIRDSLTGLFNRRCISESLTLELLSGGDAHARVGVILIDVDHFKRFNDTWGHGGGDALLQELARAMQDVFDEDDDIVCRYGGEEFVVVLPHVTADVVRARAELLLARVRALYVDCGGHSVGGITVSAGIAISPNHSTTIEGLIAAADRALYAAKSAGRDRVATPPPQVAVAA